MRRGRNGGVDCKGKCGEEGIVRKGKQDGAKGKKEKRKLCEGKERKGKTVSGEKGK